MDKRLSQIVDFCRLIDREKFIERRTYLTDGNRLENDAEHAWHMAVMVLLLKEYANEKIDTLKVISILLIHDLVEIYAGDTFAYDEAGKQSQRERELAAAEKLFSQLPEDLCSYMRSLWDEFEAWETPESKFAHSLDNFQPTMLQNASNNRSWRECNRKLSEVLRRNEKTALGSQPLWNFMKEVFIADGLNSGALSKDV